MVVTPKLLERARWASTWLPEALATSIPIWAILGGLRESWRIVMLADAIHALCALVSVPALCLVIWLQADRPIAWAKRASSLVAERWCVGIGIVTTAYGGVLRALWPTAQASFWSIDASRTLTELQAQRSVAWDLSYTVHSMLVFWVAPSLLAFGIVRRLAGSTPPSGRIVRWLLALGCIASLGLAAGRGAEFRASWHVPLAGAFGATAFAAFGARLAERRQVAANLVGAAQSLLFMAISIASHVFRARAENHDNSCMGPHPLALIGWPDGRSLHTVVAAVDVATALAAVFWLASLAAGTRMTARPRPLAGAWLATLAIGLSAQFVFVHAPGRPSEPPRHVAQTLLPTLTSDKLGPGYRPPVERVDVVLANSSPYSVRYVDERVLRLLRLGPIPRIAFDAEMASLGFDSTERGAFDSDLVGTDELSLKRLVVAAPATMPLTRLRELARDLGIGDSRPPFALVVAIDVLREQPGFEMSPAVVREYTRFNLHGTSERPRKRGCAQVRLDSRGSLRVIAAPVEGPFECAAELHVDPGATVADLVRGVGPYDFRASYTIEGGPADQEWWCRIASTAAASTDVLEHGFCHFR